MGTLARYIPLLSILSQLESAIQPNKISQILFIKYNYMVN